MTPGISMHAFGDTERFAKQLARLIRTPCTRVQTHRFPDGETRVRVRAPATRNAVLVRSLNDPNAKLVETVLAADALRRAGAGQVTLVAPYLPYMRQDKVFVPGEPLSQRVIGDWLRSSFDAVVTIEAHLHRVRRLADVAGRRSRSISAAPALAAWVQRRGRQCLVVGPDEESEPWVRSIAAAAGLPWIVGRKERIRDRAVRIRFQAVPPCDSAVIVDDIASSGVTLAVAARALRRHGVHQVDAAVVHAIFAPGALRRMRAAGIRLTVSCDTIAHPTNAIRCAPLVVQDLCEILRTTSGASHAPQRGGGR